MFAKLNQASRSFYQNIKQRNSSTSKKYRMENYMAKNHVQESKTSLLVNK